MQYFDDYPTTPRPPKKRMRLTPDDKHILIPLSNASSGTTETLKISLADVLPLPFLSDDSRQ